MTVSSKAYIWIRHTYTQLHTYPHSSLFLSISLIHTHTHRHTHTHTHTHLFSQKFPQKHTHTPKSKQAHTYTHTQTNTHTHMHPPFTASDTQVCSVGDKALRGVGLQRTSSCSTYRFSEILAHVDRTNLRADGVEREREKGREGWMDGWRV